MAKKEAGKKSFWDVFHVIASIIKVLVSVLFFVFILIFFVGLFIGPMEIYTGNVAVIPIKGAITVDGDYSFSEAVSSEKTAEWIRKAAKEERFKAIILDINSPGGSAVASDEIASAVKEARKNKTVVAVIREKGASGAYWIASATDKIYANRMSFTGSIGVIGSRLELAGLIEDYNVTYRRLVSGKYKDAGSMWKEMTSEEQELFQKLLDDVYDEFVKEVAINRKIDPAKVKEMATGFVYLGSEALELGLIDELGTKQDAIKWIEETKSIEAELYDFKKKPGFADLFGGIMNDFSFKMGQGIGASLTEEREPLLLS